MIQVVETLCSLLRIQSLTGQEAKICAFIEDTLRQKLQSVANQVEFRRIKDSLIVLGPYDAKRATICLAGHIDTVPGEDTGDRVRVENDRVIGTGASDMKGGDAVMIELITPEIFTRSPYNLIFVFYHSEEGSHEENGIHDVFAGVPELSRVNLAFILEPTENNLHLGCVGSINAKITFKGKRAHSARPWDGDNAIHRAGALLTRLSELKPKEVTFRNLVFKEVVSATMASGGLATNIVPELFTINLNLRFAPGTSAKTARERLDSLVQQSAEIQILTECPSGTVPENNVLLDKFQARYKLPEYPKQAYTDVAVFSLHGIDAVNFGPGLTSQAHQVGEYVPIENLIRSVETYRDFLLSSTDE